MEPSSEERPWLAAAAECTSRITTWAAQMVLPALLGLWLDRLLGTVWVFLLLGAALGFASGMYQLALWMRAGRSTPSEASECQKPNLTGPKPRTGQPEQPPDQLDHTNP